MVARAVPYSCAATSEPRIRHVSEPVRHSGDQKPETIRDQEREGEGALPSVRGCTGEQRGLAARERRPNTQRARDELGQMADRQLVEPADCFARTGRGSTPRGTRRFAASQRGQLSSALDAAC
jgi:hypothetical protein